MPIRIHHGPMPYCRFVYGSPRPIRFMVCACCFGLLSSHGPCFTDLLDIDVGRLSFGLFDAACQPSSCRLYTGKFTFIDLAGSERGADTMDSDRQTRCASTPSCLRAGPFIARAEGTQTLGHYWEMQAPRGRWAAQSVSCPAGIMEAYKKKSLNIILVEVSIDASTGGYHTTPHHIYVVYGAGFAVSNQ